EPRDLLPHLHRLAVAVQPRQHDALLEQRLHLVGVEFQRPPERCERLLVALLVEQGTPQQQERLQVVGVLLEHSRQPNHGGPGARVCACCSAVSAPAASPAAARPFATATSASTSSGVSVSRCSASPRASSARAPPSANNAFTSPSRASARWGSSARASRYRSSASPCRPRLAKMSPTSTAASPLSAPRCTARTASAAATSISPLLT